MEPRMRGRGGNERLQVLVVVVGSDEICRGTVAN